MYSVSIPSIFEITGEASVVEESFYSKVTEISAFCNSVRNSHTSTGMFRKVALLEILKSPPLTGVVWLRKFRV